MGKEEGTGTWKGLTMFGTPPLDYSASVNLTFQGDPEGAVG